MRIILCVTVLLLTLPVKAQKKKAPLRRSLMTPSSRVFC